MRDERESLSGERLAALPQTVASVRLFSAVLRGCVVEHLRRRFEPPAGGKSKGAGETVGERAAGAAAPTPPYRLQDCHRHLKFCPVFLAGSGGALAACWAGR